MTDTPSTGSRLFCLAIVAFITITFGAHAQLTVDNSFRPGFFVKVAPPGRALLLADGKYLLFFQMDTITDQATGSLARFLPDGTLDSSFSFSRDYKEVVAAAAAPNGQLYVAAARYVYGTFETEQILRLNSDGSIDSNFTPAIVGGSFGVAVTQRIVIQPDGKVLVAHDGIFRLLTDGSVDPNFNPVTLNDFVYGVALQSDGKILIGGSFTTINGAVVTPAIARLNADGSVDSSFQATGFSRTNARPVRDIEIQNDGQILISGNFRVGSGTFAPRMPVLRLSTTGGVDLNFNSTGLVQTIVTGRDLSLQSDGKILAVINSSVFRLNSNGSNDSSFRQPVTVDATLRPPRIPNPGLAAGAPVTLQLYPDGSMLVGGLFTDVDAPAAPTNAHFGVVRLDSAGNVDPSLVSSHRTGQETAPSSFVRPDTGSTLVTFDGTIDPPIAYDVARLMSDGTRDPNFALSSSDPSRFLTGLSARTIKPLQDGNFFVYGFLDGNYPSYGKVDANGVEDITFASNHGGAGSDITITPDGKILFAAGNDPQTTIYGSGIRLKATGELDQPGGQISDQVGRDGSGSLLAIYVGTRYFAIQPDATGLLQYFSKDQLFHLTGFTANGPSFEVTFRATELTEDFPYVYDPYTGQTLQPPFGANSATSPVQDAYVQPDGRIILTGHFTTFGNTPARGIVRINPNGTVDSSFNVGNGMQWTTTTETATFFPTIEHIEPQTDGKFLITGTFEAFDGTPASGMARLNSDGSVDTSFAAPVHRDIRSRIASAFQAQADGSFLLSGPYIPDGETTSRSLTRLIDSSLPSPTPTPTPSPTATATATPTATTTATATATATATPTTTPTATATSTPAATPTATPILGSAVNVSTRLEVGTGDNALIEGFIVQGSHGSSKTILVRAIGPSLTQFGITDALANPTLEIHDASGATVATNNDWKTTQIGGLITGDQFARINASGAAPGNDLESALIVPLAPGNYTAVVRGLGDTTGTGVVDAFDLDSGSAARLANIATRGLVRPGDQLMIAGFIVQNGAVKLVVRAIGPSLGAFGVLNALPDTTLQLRDQQGAIVQENDDWKSSQQQELESIGLQPNHDLEAALVATIQPGQYTAQVRGKGQDSGIGVVQVYFLQ